MAWKEKKKTTPGMAWEEKKKTTTNNQSTLGCMRCFGDWLMAWQVGHRRIERNKGRVKIEMADKKLKVCLVGSSGGHLTHLYMLKPFWENKDRFWVTFDKEDARSLLQGEQMYPLYFPSNRSIKALIINTWRALKILPKEKPDLIISSGAAGAVPFFWLGKLFGAKTIYIEVFDRIDASTLAGKMCYPVTDKFIVEWDEMKAVYPKSINLGSIF